MVGGVGTVGGGGEDLAQGLGADIAHGVDTGDGGLGGLVRRNVAVLQLVLLQNHLYLVLQLIHFGIFFLMQNLFQYVFYILLM